MSTILPSGEEVFVTPEEILRYLDPDGLRQLLRQERLRWNLKPNKDSDFFSKTTLFKYSGDLHNEGDHQRMDVRAFPDNGANPGYAGVYVDGGEFGMVHDHEKWDDALSVESRESITPRVEIGSRTTHLEGGPVAEPRHGHGMEPSSGEVKEYSHNREAAHVYDAHDGRVYTLSNDENFYVNNKDREPYKKLPGRTDARICDIPTDLNDLDNTSNMVADWDYHHTDNNFNNSQRFTLDNIDDRTFVYPEISKDSDGVYLQNHHMGLAGKVHYGEGDGSVDHNTQPDLTGSDRQGAGTNGHNAGKSWLPDNSYNIPGYFPGIFRSVEELEKVDLLHQRRTVLTHDATPSGRRRQNFYHFDGMWEDDSFRNLPKELKNLVDNLIPINMEGETGEPGISALDRTKQPYPYHAIAPQRSSGPNEQYDTTQLYQWRYNRINIYWHSRNLIINIQDGGAHYKVGDILRYNFLNKWIYYRVTHVGLNDTITGGHYIQPDDPDHPYPHHGFVSFEHNPSTNGVGVIFKDMTSTGRGSRLVITCPHSFEPQGTQLKNNLYAYVDVVPSVASTNDSRWSDSSVTERNDHFDFKSTAPAPAHSGINHGRGGPEPDPNSSDIPLYEHGGNATAGTHVHLFRYVIDTTGDSYEDVDGVRVYTGRWVDQGPMGVERPADIKALLFSNEDTNNFNNYYKFMLDILIDQFNREGDSVLSNNENGWTMMYLHVSEHDPWEQPIGELTMEGPSQDIYQGYCNAEYLIKLLRPAPDNNILDHQAFFDKRINPVSGEISIIEITHKVFYYNAGTRVAFLYNPESKTDPKFGYGHEPRGWTPIAGTITR